MVTNIDTNVFLQYISDMFLDKFRKFLIISSVFNRFKDNRLHFLPNLAIYTSFTSFPVIWSGTSSRQQTLENELFIQ